MGWLYTFHFSLESQQPVMTRVLSASVACVFTCAQLQIQDEALTLTLLYLIETAPLYKLRFSLGGFCVCVCPSLLHLCLCVASVLFTFVCICGNCELREEAKG